MENTKNTLMALCSEMTISGYEYRAEEKIRELCGDIFDEIRTDPMGSYILVKRCGRIRFIERSVGARESAVCYVVNFNAAETELVCGVDKFSPGQIIPTVC